MTAPDQPATLKSVRPDDWPERLNAGKAVVRFPSGIESGSWYSRPDVEKTREYIRADLATPAATDPKVTALVEAALKEGMRIATIVPIEQVPEAIDAATAAILRAMEAEGR